MTDAGPVMRGGRSRLVVTQQASDHLERHPVATVHATAALVAWLYGQPQAVADQGEAVLELAENAAKFGKFIF